MKRYLIVKYYREDTYFTDEITKSDLLLLKDDMIEAIIDTTNWTMFDASKNAWVEIKSK